MVGDVDDLLLEYEKFRGDRLQYIFIVVKGWVAEIDLS